MLSQRSRAARGARFVVRLPFADIVAARGVGLDGCVRRISPIAFVPSRMSHVLSRSGRSATRGGKFFVPLSCHEVLGKIRPKRSGIMRYDATAPQPHPLTDAEIIAPYQADCFLAKLQRP